MHRAFLVAVSVAVTIWSDGCGSCSTNSGAKNSCSTTSATVTIKLHPDTTTGVMLGSTLQFTADVSGYSNTKLTWQVNGHDGGNLTVGTISDNGLYTPPVTVPNPAQVTVTAVSEANPDDTASVGVIIRSGISIGVSPAAADVLPGKQQKFTSTVTGNSNTGVHWAVAGIAGGNSTVGTIDSQGVYTAPATVSRAPWGIAVTATAEVDATKTAQATVTLHKDISVSLAPGSASVETFAQQKFTASVSADANATFTWQVNGISGGNQVYGSIADTTDSTGAHFALYTAPNHVPTAGMASGANLANGGSKTIPVTITATYSADSYFLASSTVTVTSRNQKAQNLPTVLGVSGGNAGDVNGVGCCGGTLGALVARGGKQYLLSTSHVLARTDQGSAGDAIIQPGLPDSSCSLARTNTVATLAQFVNLESSTGSAVADAALAEVLTGKVLASGAISQLGGSTSEGQPTDGAPHAGAGIAPSLFEADGATPLAVAKSGRATGLTCSSISAIHVTASVTYQKGCDGAEFQQTFSNLVVVEGGDFSAQGDSGALIVTEHSADPLALLVASSDSATLGSPVADVLLALADPNSGETPVFVGDANPHAVAACSLPGPQASALPAASRAVVGEDRLKAATAVRDEFAAELLGRADIKAIGIARSLDEPGEPALLLVTGENNENGNFPRELGRIRTRLMQSEGDFNHRVLTSDETTAFELAAAEKPPHSIFSGRELAKAKSVHALHARELLRLPGVEGVGIARSADNPEEAAIVLYVEHGAAHSSLPADIDGVRTRIRETSSFRPASRGSFPARTCTGPSRPTASR